MDNDAEIKKLTMENFKICERIWYWRISYRDIERNNMMPALRENMGKKIKDLCIESDRLLDKIRELQEKT